MPAAPLDPAEFASTTMREPRPFSDALLMCRKCARRLGPDGKAMRKSLKRALKTHRWGKVRLVQRSCFSLCPKRGEVLAAVRTIGERRLLVIEPGEALEPALDYLLEPPRDRDTC
jgi:hypothetical protein